MMHFRAIISLDDTIDKYLVRLRGEGIVGDDVISSPTLPIFLQYNTFTAYNKLTHDNERKDILALISLDLLRPAQSSYILDSLSKYSAIFVFGTADNPIVNLLLSLNDARIHFLEPSEYNVDMVVGTLTVN